MAPSAGETPSPYTYRVDSLTFMGTAWGGTGLALIFVAFRLYVRFVSFHHVYADDFLVVLAVLSLLASTILWQTQQTAMYNQFKLVNGEIFPTPENLAHQQRFFRSIVAILFLFYSSLWSVKLSVLLFFRRLGQNVTGQKVWWWWVLGFIVVTWGTSIGTIPFPCLIGSLEYIFAECKKTSRFIFQRRTLHYNCAVDVISDVMIITIPVLMLWNVRISWRKKLALMGLFSLTIIVIIFAIVRVAVVTTHNVQWDVTWLYMWINIEMAVSVIVACLASFRQLWVKSNQPGYVKQSDEQSSSERGLRSRYLRSMGSSGSKGSFFPCDATAVRNTDPCSKDPTVQILALDNIFVRREVDSRSHPVTEGMQIPRACVSDTCYSTLPGHDTGLA